AAAEEHLLKALAGDLEDKDAAHGLLGQLYLSTNRPAEAEFHLSKAVATHSIFRLPLARTFAARGNAGRARQEAELAVRLLGEGPIPHSPTLPPRLAWPDATTSLEDSRGAIGARDEGSAVTGAPTYRVAAARVYLAWFDTRKKEPAPTANELLTLLDK